MFMIAGVQEKISEIAAASPELTLLNYGYNVREYGDPFSITLPHGCEITPNFIKRDEAELLPPRVLVGRVFVPEELRGNGIGRRLSGALGAYAVSRNAKQMESHIVSEYALDNLRSLYGDERLRFWQDKEKTEPVNNNVDAIRRILESSKKREENLEHRRRGFVADIDLAGLDTSGWELPKSATAQ